MPDCTSISEVKYIAYRSNQSTQFHWNLFIICSFSKQIQVRQLNRKSVYKTEEAKRIRFYILNRFIEYLKNYDKILEKNFPTTMKTYRVFMDGIKYFISDTKEYFRIVL